MVVRGSGMKIKEPVNAYTHLAGGIAALPAVAYLICQAALYAVVPDSPPRALGLGAVWNYMGSSAGRNFIKTLLDRRASMAQHSFLYRHGVDVCHCHLSVDSKAPRGSFESFAGRRCSLHGRRNHLRDQTVPASYQAPGIS